MPYTQPNKFCPTFHSFQASMWSNGCNLVHTNNIKGGSVAFNSFFYLLKNYIKQYLELSEDPHLLARYATQNYGGWQVFWRVILLSCLNLCVWVAFVEIPLDLDNHYVVKVVNKRSWAIKIGGPTTYFIWLSDSIQTCLSTPKGKGQKKKKKSCLFCKPRAYG